MTFLAINQPGALGAAHRMARRFLGRDSVRATEAELYFAMRVNPFRRTKGVPINFQGQTIGPEMDIVAFLPTDSPQVNRWRGRTERVIGTLHGRTRGARDIIESVTQPWEEPTAQRERELREEFPEVHVPVQALYQRFELTPVQNHWGGEGAFFSRAFAYYHEQNAETDFSHLILRLNFVDRMLHMNGSVDFGALTRTLNTNLSVTRPSLGVVTSFEHNVLSATLYDENNVVDPHQYNWQLDWAYPPFVNEQGFTPDFSFSPNMQPYIEGMCRLYTTLVGNVGSGWAFLGMGVYIGAVKMTPNGNLTNVQNPQNERDIRPTCEFFLTVRLSRHPVIAIVNVLIMFMRFWAELRIVLQEGDRYNPFDNRIQPQEGFVIKFVRVTQNPPVDINATAIRAGSFDTVRNVGLLYRHAPCWLVQTMYTKFWKLVREKGKVLYSPKAEENCLFLAYYHARLKKHPVNLTANERNRLHTRARGRAFHYNRWWQTLEDPGYEIKSVASYIDYLTQSPRRENIRFYDFRANCVAELLRDDFDDQNIINVAVSFGHAYAFVDPPDWSIVPLNLRPSLKRKYPHLPPPIEIEEESLGVFKRKNNLSQSYRLAVLDLETTNTGTLYATGFYPLGVKARLGVFSEDELDRCEIFPGSTSLQQFFNWALNNLDRGPRHLIFAHFGGGFDFLYYVREAIAYEKTGQIVNYFSKCVEVQGSVIKLRHVLRRPHDKQIRGQYLNIYLRDSLPLLKSSLGKLSQAYQPKFPKLPDLIHHEDVSDQNWVEVFEGDGERYLKHDLLSLAEILMIFAKQIQKLFNIDPLPLLTLSSLSRTIFLEKYYFPEVYPLCQLPILFEAILRKAYFGGRVEAHNLGVLTGPVYYFDVTSEYPYTMLFDLPYGAPRHITNTYELGRGIPYGLLKVKIVGGWRNAPNVFPVRGPDGLIFPYFEEPYEMYVWSEEVSFCLARDFPYQFEILEAWEFQKASYYQHCIRDLYQIKRTAKDPVQRLLGKLLCNSAYGIWGMKKSNVDKIQILTATRTNPNPLMKYIETMTLKKNAVMSTTHFMKVTTHMSGSVTYLPIAVAVTAKARIHLYSLMYDVIQAGGRIYYTDTDSIITNIDIRDPQYGINSWTTNPSALGHVKVEFDEGPAYRDEVILLGAKMYAFPGGEDFKPKLTLKGFYRGFTWGSKTYDEATKVVSLTNPTKIISRGGEKITYEDFRLMAQGWTVEHEVTRLVSKTRGWIDQVCEVGSEKRIIRLKMNYKKGRVDFNDGFVHPWVWNGEKFI